MDKKCTKCEGVKRFEEFRKSTRYKDGFYSRCKECMKEYERENLDNEKKKLIRTKYRENNRERIREQDKEAYRKDPDKFRAKARVAQKKYFQTPKGREKYKNENLKLRKIYPEKARARSLLSNAICDGKIIRPSNCSLCGIDGKIEAHHPDYSKPYDVVWVCKSCHLVVHDRIKIRRERLSPETPNKGDAIVQTSEETTREEPEAVLPPP